MNVKPAFQDYLMSFFVFDILKARHVFTKEGKIPVKIPVRSSYTGKIFFRTYWKRPQDISPEHMKYVLPEYQKMLKQPKTEDETEQQQQTKDEYNQRLKHSDDWAEYKKKLDEENARKKAEREQHRKEREEQQKQQGDTQPKKTWQRGRKRLSDKEWEKRRKEEWVRNAQLAYWEKQRELYPDDPTKWVIPPEKEFTPPDDPNLWKRKTPYKSKADKDEAKVIFEPEVHAKGEWAHIRVGGQSLEQIFKIPKSLITPPPDITEQADKDRYIMDATQKYVYDALVNPIAQENHCSKKEARRIAMEYMKAYGIVWHLHGERWKMHEKDCVNWCHAVQKLKRYMWENARDDYIEPPDVEPEFEPEPDVEPEPEPDKDDDEEEQQPGLTVNGVYFPLSVVNTIKGTVWKNMTPNIDSFTEFASTRIRRAGQQLQMMYTGVTAIEFLPDQSRLMPFFKATVTDEDGGEHSVTFAASQAMVQWDEVQSEPEIPDIEPEPEIEPEIEPEPDVEPEIEPEIEPEPDIEPEVEPEPEKYQPKVQLGKNVINRNLLSSLGQPLGRVLDTDEFLRRIDTALEDDNTTAGKIKKIKGIEVYDSWGTDTPDGGYILRLSYSAGRGKGDETTDIVIDSNNLFTYDMENISYAEGTPEYTDSGRRINYEEVYKELIDRAVAYNQTNGREFSVEDIMYLGEGENEDFDKVKVMFKYNLRYKVGRGRYNVLPMTATLPSSLYGTDLVSREIIQPKKKEPTAEEQTREQYFKDTEQQRKTLEYVRYHYKVPNSLKTEGERMAAEYREEVHNKYDAERDRLTKKYAEQCKNTYDGKFNSHTVLYYLCQGVTDENERNRIVDEFNTECRDFYELQNELSTVDSWTFVSKQGKKNIAKALGGFNPDLEYTKRNSGDVKLETEALFSDDPYARGRAAMALHNQITPYNTKNNCQRVVFAYEAWRRGYNVMASDPEYGQGAMIPRVNPDTGKTDTVKDDIADWNLIDLAWEGSAKVDFTSSVGRKKMFDALSYVQQVQGDARFIACMSFKSGGAHVFNIEKHGDDVVFIDIQHPDANHDDHTMATDGIWHSKYSPKDQLMLTMNCGQRKYNSRTGKFGVECNLNHFWLQRTDDLPMNFFTSMYMQSSDGFQYDETKYVNHLRDDKGHPITTWKP